MSRYRTAPEPRETMPPGIPYIVGNEAAERFSFYGMRGILFVFMTNYLFLMDDRPGDPVSDAKAREWFHLFVMFVYLTPIAGSIIADAWLGKYRTILWLSLGYCVGHGLLALMGSVGSAGVMLFLGLTWITIGAGGIKPCVSAHVGDQFGKSNRHLLTKVFNYFYWSINLGAFLSHLATPWLLEWHGPHWAFGVPGILMAIATFTFWLGRTRFVHIPARGSDFLREMMSAEGIRTLLKLSAIYVFVAMFWALFDQTASLWIQQAEDMNRRFLGTTWLPSQVQAINPILVLTFIPLFTWVIYPFVERFVPFTPLRKMSVGFFLMTAGFLVVTLAQEAIDAGHVPSVGWQFLAFVLVTASEILISIVCLEFSYTQAPRTMKSLIMGFFFLSVFLGNFFTAGVNRVIQIPEPLHRHDFAENANRHPGFDRKPGTADDFLEVDGVLETPARPVLTQAADRLVTAISGRDWRCPDEADAAALLDGLVDPAGVPLRYTLITRNQCRISSAGADGQHGTRWDESLTITIERPTPTSDRGLFRAFRPDTPWLERRKRELGQTQTVPEGGDSITATAGPRLERSFQVGGHTRLEGAAYFWFFTGLIGLTSVLFLVIARFYRSKEYLHEESS